MSIALERIQAAPESLLSDDSLAARLRELSSSARVKVEILGLSHEGRPIWCIVVGTPETLERLPYHEALNRRLAGPLVNFQSLAEIEVHADDPPTIADNGRVAVMLTGASFGFEAAHVEALVELAERLATSPDPAVLSILDRLLVVFVPLMNPDGRAAAIRDWQSEPLSDGHHGSGNAYGFLINRDFFNVSQPETRAVRAAINRYHPVAAYDPHEDMYYLSHTLPYVCWTPPFAKPHHPEIHPRILQCISRLGGAIADEWMRQGFNYLYHPDGDHSFLTLFRLGGRFHLHLCLQGVAALITESARMPGAQTWEDRIAQKVTAGHAFLRELAANVEFYVAARYAVRSELGSADAFILPWEKNTPAALRACIEPLLQREVLIYKTDGAEPAYVIPTNQPNGRLARALLMVAPWNHVALPPMAGVTCVRLSALPIDQQELWRLVALQRVLEVDATARAAVEGPAPAVIVVPNEAEGIAVANRALTCGAAVERTDDGEIAIRTQPRSVLQRALKHIPVSVSPGRLAAGRAMRVPRIALYAGQGVDQRHHLLQGGIRYALEQLEFPYLSIETDEVIRGGLDGFGLLIVSGGWAREIVDGWEDPGPRWRLPGPPKGLGQAGLEAIRSFVESGGRYLGLGSGGGILATAPYLGLVDAVVVDEMLGEARTFVQVVRDHPLTAGLWSFVDETGRTIAGRLAVPYYSEPYSHLHGGPIFKAGPKAVVLAEYVGIDDPKGVRDPAYFDTSAHAPAVLFQPAGRGWAAVVAFEPGLRGVWRSTLPVLANTVFFATEQ